MEAPMQGEKNQTGAFSRIKRPLAFVPLTSFALVVLIILAYFSPLNFLRNAQAASITPLPGIRTHLTTSSRMSAEADPNTPLTIAIGLRMHNQDGLEQYVKDTSQTKNKLKRALTSEQLLQAYSPFPAEQQAVIDYMQQNGFTTTQTFKHRLVVGFSGTIGQAEQAFHISINNYTAKNGQSFYAPATDPQVPSTIAPYISTIQGLDNTVRYSHGPVAPVKPGQHTALSANATSNAVTCPGNEPAGKTPVYYTPGQIKSAYNTTALQNTFKGDGQHVALVEFSDYKSADIQSYANCFGGNTVPVTRIKADQQGGNIDDGTVEAELDMELILSTAPRLAGLHVYETQNTAQGNLLMWGQIIADAVPVVSTSWGICEADMTPSDFQTENSLFAIAAAQGQSIFAASGDSGSSGNLNTGSNCADSNFHVLDPASQPYVTGVGGTSLYINSNGTYNRESTWNSQNGASGGGISTQWAMPSWQQNVTKYTPTQSCGSSTGYCRQVPDVSLSADPSYGYLMYVSPCNTNGTCPSPNWYDIGGTSAAAPMFAAYTALANQQSLSQGYFNLGFMNPLLYGLAQNPTLYANDFHDITTGNNNLVGGSQYAATGGYDLATGLGTVKSGTLFSDLVNLAGAQTGTRKSPAATKWYFAEGNVGDAFEEFISILNPSTTQTANVYVHYLFPKGAPALVIHQVPPSTRGTVSVMKDINYPENKPARTSVSVIVESVPNSNGVAVPIVAERPMYFNFANRVLSGTDVIGTNDATQTNFYFAIGDTRQTSDSKQYYNTFITMLNPSTTTTATVTATYYANGQVLNTDTVNLGPMQRGTLNPASKNIHQQISMKITSSIGIVVERPMYFVDNIPTAGGSISGATTAVAASATSKDWLFAEGNTGSTGSKYQENLALANFTAAPTNAQVKLIYDNGQVQTIPVTVPAYSQYVVDVNAARAQFGNGTDGVSIAVHNDDGAIVAERFSYFSFNRSLANGTVKVITGGDDAVGEANATGHTAYSFAEGYTIDPNYEQLTLFNPDANNTIHVAVTIYAHNTVVQKTVEMKPLKRTIININDIVVPMAQAYPMSGGAYNVSMSVQGLDGHVVAERVYYFVSGNVSHGGTTMFGYTNDSFI
ncbi:S53 family peptidase [Dictyobacter kobayashii]|uniref:Peptidase S53 domain-containing protein n=1 Tax=Dictyobacter kobayashii TaxID=2014872 RepID=A0A402AHG5_9CHLR|nr:S53 family peptidase [Dictyobacter kobayashii]GCE18539.1 hypothetical protein KDK_23390 [Dictyobacter kobayashii]